MSQAEYHAQRDYGRRSRHQMLWGEYPATPEEAYPSQAALNGRRPFRLNMEEIPPIQDTEAFMREWERSTGIYIADSQERNVTVYGTPGTFDRDALERQLAATYEGRVGTEIIHNEELLREMQQYAGHGIRPEVQQPPLTIDILQQALADMQAAAPRREGMNFYTNMQGMELFQRHIQEEMSREMGISIERAGHQYVAPIDPFHFPGHTHQVTTPGGDNPEN